jgi:DNA-binding MarR family transcriptional regulator
MSLQNAVLSMLVDGPDYGYGLARRLEGERSRTAVYNALRRLRQQGLIERTRVPEGAKGRLRKYYRATESGGRADAIRLAHALPQGSSHEAPPRAGAGAADRYTRCVIRVCGPALEITTEVSEAPLTARSTPAGRAFPAGGARVPWGTPSPER